VARRTRPPNRHPPLAARKGSVWKFPTGQGPLTAPGQIQLTVDTHAGWEEKEGAAWLGVSERTVGQWGPRGKLLPADWLVSDRMPAWAWRTWEEIGTRNGHFTPVTGD
jgi:hypothetical protein